jgi:acetyl esterase/lipase
MAVDGRPSRESVRIVRDVRYGALPSELMDIIIPTKVESTLSTTSTILYVHGGGFVSVHRSVLNHSLTPLGRAGFTVFSIDYPLAPNDKHPAAIVSVLRALSFLRSAHGVKDIILLGDSAGGSLAGMAVAAVMNPGSDWPAPIKRILESASFPNITRVALLYSICDTTSWSSQCELDLFNNVVVLILELCLFLYRNHADEKVTIVENMHNIKRFPPTFLLCGHNDVLKHSHEVLASELAQINVPVESVITQGFHGYHGLPVPFSFGLWRTTVFPATCALIRWLTNGDESRVPVLPAWSWAEYDIHLLVILIAIHAFPFFVLLALY